MDIEALSFALQATGVGMSVVFLFLGLLSVLMAVITRVIPHSDVAGAGGGAPQGAVAGSGGTASESAGNSGGAPARLPHEIIAAAAAAFLDDEQLQGEMHGGGSWAAHIGAQGRGGPAWVSALEQTGESR